MTVLTSTEPRLSFQPDALPADLWIGGRWRPTPKRIDVVDPSTGGVIASVADASIEDAMDALAAAHAAAPGWAATAPRARAEMLRRCYELMIERKAMLAELIALENGKALPDAARRGGLFRGILPLVRRGGGAPQRRVRHRPCGRQPHPRHPPADRRRGARHPLELPRRHGRPQDRPGARRRLHLRDEAGDRDAADRLRARRHPRRGRRPRRRRQRADHLALRRHRQRDAARSPGAQALVHRLDRGRPHASARGGRHHRQLLDGARRQRPVHRLRRCRPRRRPRRRDDREDAQRRRGLHRRQPLLRAGRASSAPSRTASPRGWPRCRSGPATTPPPAAAR